MMNIFRSIQSGIPIWTVDRITSLTLFTKEKRQYSPLHPSLHSIPQRQSPQYVLYVECSFILFLSYRYFPYDISLWVVLLRSCAAWFRMMASPLWFCWCWTETFRWISFIAYRMIGNAISLRYLVTSTVWIHAFMMTETKIGAVDEMEQILCFKFE